MGNSRRTRSLIIKGLIGLAILMGVALASFLVWALYIPSPMTEAMSALESTANVTASGEDLLIFAPVGREVTTGFIFYPGARVDHRAYAPAMRSIAEKGFLVVVPKMPLNMAMFAPNRAKEVQRSFPGVSTWVVGGHSMGGAFAAQFAASNQDTVKGLILCASYPPSSADLRNSSVKVLSIYGSSDGVATTDEVLAGRSLLPDDAKFAEIKGGNHAQFGWYGVQSGDLTAGITRDEQQSQTVALTVEFLKLIAKP